MDTYIIRLPDEKVRPYQVITFFVLLLNCIIFGYIFFNTGDKRTGDLSSFGFLLSMTYIILFFIKYYTKKLSRYKLEISFIVLAVLWLVMGKVVIAIIVFVCAIMGLYTTRKPLVSITKEKIIYPSFPKKVILWKDVSNVMLKDDILTIDLKNNKLMQTSILPESGIGEAAFNTFCKERILEEGNL